MESRAFWLQRNAKFTAIMQGFSLPKKHITIIFKQDRLGRWNYYLFLLVMWQKLGLEVGSFLFLHTLLLQYTLTLLIPEKIKF